MMTWKKTGKKGLYIQRNQRDRDFFDLYHKHNNFVTMIALIHEDYLEFMFNTLLSGKIRGAENPIKLKDD